MNKIRVISPFERPLAITQPKLQQIAEVWMRHSAGQRIDFSGLEAVTETKSGRQTGGHGYTVQDGVAIIDVEGVLGKGMNLFMWFSGGTSTELLQKDLADALADPKVESIILRVDSPGGDVDGTQLFADAVMAARKQKPVVAWITGLGASAAYWIASQADRIILADQTTWVGSIGVVAMHVDYSKSDEQEGVKRTEITAGKYKRIASDTGPLSQEGRQTIQDQVDSIYKVFLQSVADGRDKTPEQVHEEMGDGRIFMGADAIAAGLADEIGTLEAVIGQLATDATKLQKTGARASAKHSTGESTMKTYTEEEMTAARAEAHAKGKSEAEAANQAAIAAAATSERERIKGVLDQQIHAGHKDLIQTLAFDGKTTPGEAAIQVNAAEKAALKGKLNDLKEDGKDAHTEASESDRAKEAEQTKQAVKAAKDGDKADDAVITSADMQARVAEAASKGRKISVLEAKAELERERKEAKK